MRKLLGLAALLVVFFAQGGEARAEWGFQYRSGEPSPYDRIYQYARPHKHRGKHRRHNRHYTEHRHYAPAPVECWSEWMRVPGGYSEIRRCAPVQRFAPVAPPGFYFTLD